MNDLRILKAMLDNPERVQPYNANDFAEMSAQTAYTNLRKLTDAGIIERTHGGWILGKSILNSGSLYYAAISRAAATQNRSQIYGK